jgi:hypothetical protein
MQWLKRKNPMEDGEKEWRYKERSKNQSLKGPRCMGVYSSNFMKV